MFFFSQSQNIKAMKIEKKNIFFYLITRSDSNNCHVGFLRPPSFPSITAVTNWKPTNLIWHEYNIYFVTLPFQIKSCNYFFFFTQLSGETNLCCVLSNFSKLTKNNPSCMRHSFLHKNKTYDKIKYISLPFQKNYLRER